MSELRDEAPSPGPDTSPDSVEAPDSDGGPVEEEEHGVGDEAGEEAPPEVSEGSSVGTPVPEDPSALTSTETPAEELDTAAEGDPGTVADEQPGDESGQEAPPET